MSFNYVPSMRSSVSERQDYRQEDQKFIYKAPWVVYSVGISTLDYFLENKSNFVYVVRVNPDNMKLEMVTKFTHFHAPSKIRWHKNQCGENIITAGKHITIWSYNDLEQKVVHQTDLINRNENFPNGPSLQFDIHHENMTRIASCSLDSTISLWDLQKNKIINQTKVHDKEVNDISFGYSPQLVVTVSSDNTCRQIDLRESEEGQVFLKHSEPLFKVSCDKQDGIFVAMSDLNKEVIYIYDTRFPNAALRKLKGHIDMITQIGWNPFKRKILGSTSDDGRAFLWDMDRNYPDEIIETFYPRLEINDFEWSTVPGIIGVSYNTNYQVLKIE